MHEFMHLCVQLHAGSRTNAGHLAVVKYLLAEGAGLEQRSVMKETALM